MLEIVLTREDANTEFALLSEWLVEDRAEVAEGQPVCVVETTKATVEVEAPGAGTIAFTRTSQSTGSRSQASGALKPAIDWATRTT